MKFLTFLKKEKQIAREVVADAAAAVGVEVPALKVRANKKPMPAVAGLLQAIAGFVYVAAVSAFLAIAGQTFGAYLSQLTAQIMMFMIFVLSALVLGLSFLAYPLFLYQRNQARAALGTVAYTALWFFFLIALFILVLVKS